MSHPTPAHPSKVLVNDPRNAVLDSLEGFLLTRPDLARLDGFPGTKVVVRALEDANKVAVLSGGGAGHEPAHVGLVGQGMLSAAVSGDVFASPHVRAILAAMRHVAGSSRASFPGIVAVVKNYTGDRLAFGLAAERARSEGIKVETVYVADDAAVDGGSVTGRRGLAGTVLVHKVCGALAEAGADLATVAAAGRAVAKHAVTIGASMTVCSVPGVPISDRLNGEGSMEVGLGIHGEPGKRVLSKLLTADELACELVNSIVVRLAELQGGDGARPATATTPVAVLVNNLGGLSNLEMGIVTGSCVQALRSHAPCLQLELLLTGPLMTALDMRGVSLTVLPLDCASWAPQPGLPADITQALLYPTSGVPWPVATLRSASDFTPHVLPLPAESALATAGPGVPPGVTSTSSSPICSDATVSHDVGALLSCSAALVADVDRLNELDRISGDGDCGHTMEKIAGAITATAHSFAPASDDPSARATVLLQALALGVGEAAGGTSGVLYAIMLQTAANSMASQTEGSVAVRLATAFHAATDAASHYASAVPGNRTMLDALVPAADAACAGSARGDSALSILAAVAAAAEAGATSTADMVPRAGRSSYLSFDVVKGHPDPGAVAAATWLTALQRYWESLPA